MHKKTALVIAIIISLSAGCRTNKNNNQTSSKKQITISGVIKYHRPYCGGAAPSPEQENGKTTKFANHKMFVTEANTKERKIVKEFTTDANGHFSIKLPAGKYNFFGGHKILPFDEFVAQNSGGGNIVLKSSECLKNWYNTPEFVVNSAKDTTVNFTYSEKCFTKLNPCLEYQGAPRP